MQARCAPRPPPVIPMLPTDEMDMATLFGQLGLDGSEAAIDAFVAEHSPLPAAVELADASFWNENQASLLRETKLADGPMALTVDELDARLRDDPAG